MIEWSDRECASSFHGSTVGDLYFWAEHGDPSPISGDELAAVRARRMYRGLDCE